jgi:hypothetical protein
LREVDEGLMAIGTSINIRVEMDKTADTFGEIATAISKAGGEMLIDERKVFSSKVTISAAH